MTFQGILLLAGVLLIGVSYVPGCGVLFRAGVGVSVLALGLHHLSG